MTKNMTSQQFQHCVELQLIQVMKMKKHRIQFASIVNWIQMKLRWMMYKTKNMTNQLFQHCVESQLSEVMMMKMRGIQFALIVNWIQMKLSCVIYTTKNLTTQQCQSHKGSRDATMSKSCESICDRQSQSEMRFRKQIVDSLIQSNNSINSYGRMLNHR
jgi:hypothetical protein